MKLIWLFVIAFLCIQCGSPLINAAPENEADLEKLVVEKGEHLLASDGCPIRFPGVPLCAKMEWFDSEGRLVESPIYYASNRRARISAKVYFWSAIDGWPVDPLKEFPEAKKIRIKLFMPTHGHGSDAFSDAQAIKSRVGQYNFKDIRFIMDCDDENPWELRLQLNRIEEIEDDDPHDPEDRDLFHQAVLKISQLERR